MDRGPVGPRPDLLGPLDALASEDAPTRAAMLLRTPNAPGAEETAMAALSDPEVEVRRAAVQVLARVAGPRGVRAIMETAIRDPAPAVRAEAVAALGRIVGHGMEPRSSS